jgi:RNA polymerase sigma-70 factor (ECF subfamily)
LERGELIHKAVAALPEKQRVVLILHKFEGFTASEIAEILGIPLTSVEARLRRAKSRLKQKLLAVLKNDHT